MKRTLSDYIITLLSITSGIATLIGFILLFKKDINNQGWIGITFLGSFATFFLAYNLYLISKYRGQIKYADAFQEINIGYADLHKVYREKINDVSVITDKITSAIDSISNVFTNIYGHQISVCVKLIVSSHGRPKATTLTRDRKSSANDRRSGIKDRGEHWIELNSDFNFIYSNYEDDNNDTSYYYQTNLNYRVDYQNTRLNSNWLPKKSSKLMQMYIRKKNWPLKYKSTLVVPIVPLLADDQSQKAIRGFLCIDSPYGKCFNTKYDVEILKGLSDGLCNSIDLLLLNTAETK